MTTFDDQFKSIFMVDDLSEYPTELALEIAERRTCAVGHHRSVNKSLLKDIIKPTQSASGFNINWSEMDKNIVNIHSINYPCKILSKDELDKLLIVSRPSEDKNG